MGAKITGNAEIDAALLSMQKLGTDQSGWDTLYADPATGKFWELTYPQSHLHGGGPRELLEISSLAASVKYADARDWKKPISYTLIVQRLNIHSLCPVCRTEGFDYQPGANPHHQLGAPVQCPKCGWKGMLGGRDLIAAGSSCQDRSADH
jgi:hypothetical protein